MAKKLNFPVRKVRFAAAAVLACCVTVSLYYPETWAIAGVTSPLYQPSISLGLTDDESTEFILNTSGCKIPKITIDFKKYFKNRHHITAEPYCGERGVFLKKVDGDHVQLAVKRSAMDKHLKGKTFSHCCYQFVSRSQEQGHQDTKLTYSHCIEFKTSVTVLLESDVIYVKCFAKYNGIINIYKDVFGATKKIDNRNQSASCNETNKWNVLVMGMDTMSRARVQDSMPLMLNYFKKNNWLDFKGYQKVGFNTFPNVVAMLSGKRMSSIYHECGKSMDHCNEFMMWSRYRENGYVTAYGEDQLSLPDTFSRYDGFTMPPTNHYMRPLFLTGETVKTGDYIYACTGKQPSAQHIFDYALDFTRTYKNDSFFGFFWMNSHSHDIINSPYAVDVKFKNFFKSLDSAGALKNTFIVFVSDHGVRYGEVRVPIESYYEERLPAFYMWVPTAFQEQFPVEYANIKTNQLRLTTPYDLFMTMGDILTRSCSLTNNLPSEACPDCRSLFRPISLDRTCADASVHDKWCTCHPMVSVGRSTPESTHAVNTAVLHIKNIVSSIKTTKCQKCSQFRLKSVLRNHLYFNQNKTMYVVAYVLSPGNVAYEATVAKVGDKYEVVGEVYTISTYNTRGNCVQNQNERQFCVCSRTC